MRDRGCGHQRALSAAALMSLAAMPAYANAYLPLEHIAAPIFLLAFLPVCAIEAEWYHRRLKTSRLESIRVSGTANVLSSVLGTPLSWLCAGLVGRWADPGEGFDPGGYYLLELDVPDHGRHLFYMFVWVLPAFLVSVCSERWVLNRMLKSVRQEAVTRAVWSANAMSYAFLYLALYFLPVMGLPMLERLLQRHH